MSYNPKTDQIHEIDRGVQTGRFVIASHHCWMPGAYESREAAVFAFEFCEDHVVRLRDDANATNDGIITMAAMTKLKEERGLSCGQGAHRPGWKDGDPIVFDDGRAGS